MCHGCSCHRLGARAVAKRCACCGHTSSHGSSRHHQSCLARSGVISLVPAEFVHAALFVALFRSCNELSSRIAPRFTLTHHCCRYWLKWTGSSSWWTFLMYIVQFVDGMVMFAVILLIGTGWSFLKPYLHVREKRLLMMVLPMQVRSHNLSFT